MVNFEEVYNLQVDTVFKICVLYLKKIDDAKETTQDTFIRYLKYNPEFENIKREKNWFIKTATNICKNILKSSWFKKIVCSEDLSHFYQEEKDYDILQEILELPHKYKMSIYLFYYEGYSTEEIAQILDMKPSTVRSNLHRGRKLLKISLGSDYINEG
ncbi:RNA polymerase sigma factor [Paeniclostridium hominis]|uniref:RNA polymerase sigma factor n=1 Tax=Paeniclostridium hominis TaxID=2764329 RepID=UPI0022E0EBB3|nr:RNA polymerase sigma factor [Paeniclostridium hominis]